MNKAYVDSILGIEGLKGVIMEAYGAGNAPDDEWFLKRIRNAVEKGILVLDITQCYAGSVSMGAYETSRLLFEAGVIGGYDITTEAATTKMMYLFGKEVSNDEIKLHLNSCLKGEITIT